MKDYDVQVFNEQLQYSLTEINESERLFGRNFYFTGGMIEVTDMLAYAAPLKPKRILDIGSGLGGPAFLMARKYHAQVDGIDISHSMNQLANERVVEEGLTEQVQFFLGDILTYDMPGPYDLIYSNCVFLHIHDKNLLIKRMYDLLTDGGKLLFGDYCIEKESEEMAHYIHEYHYHLLHQEEWDQRLKQCGFRKLTSEDCTIRLATHSREILAMDHIGAEWENVLKKRLDRFAKGEQQWCVFCYQR